MHTNTSKNNSLTHLSLTHSVFAPFSSFKKHTNSHTHTAYTEHNVQKHIITYGGWQHTETGNDTTAAAMLPKHNG